MNKSTTTLILFPKSFFGGHEQMAMKHFVLSKKYSTRFRICNRGDFQSTLQFYWYLFLSRPLGKKVLLINGSPYGHVFLKLYLKLAAYHVLEYTPFPELPEMKDRAYHSLVAKLNKVLVNERILIDDWQVDFSEVKINYVLKNYV